MSLDTRGVQIPNGSKNPDDEQYYFKEKELVQLETEVSDELVEHYGKSEKFISDLSKAFAEVAE